MTRRRMAAERAIMERLAEAHARGDYRAGDAHLYRLTERLAAQGKIPAFAWELYRAAYAELRAPVGAPSVLCRA